MSKKSLHGESPFGMSRKFRRALYSSVRTGVANEAEVQRFQSLGKEAYPWMNFKEVVLAMKRASVPETKHVKAHKVK